MIMSAIVLVVQLPWLYYKRLSVGSGLMNKCFYRTFYIPLKHWDCWLQQCRNLNKTTVLIGIYWFAERIAALSVSLHGRTMWHIAAGQVNSSHYAIHEAAGENPARWFSPCSICKPSIPKHRLTPFLRRLHPSLSFSDATALLITSLHKLDRLIMISRSSQLYRTEKASSGF